eukprot:TRINITY_DN4095_c0_g2_i2.p2 TRINITY_DN4095_c0_g2~~TRINITY_DN4095_c0_g2_i2.p2  ORF type:complete len:180 (+),score=17.09 TRINITY_DN4095_c0_g2_i2:101-640(+)
MFSTLAKSFLRFPVRSSQLFSVSTRRFSSGVLDYPKNSHIPAPKIADQIVWINIVNTYGQFERVAAFEGESLLQTLDRYKVEGIPGERGLCFISLICALPIFDLKEPAMEEKLLILCKRDLLIPLPMVLSAAIATLLLLTLGEDKWGASIRLSRETWMRARCPSPLTPDLLAVLLLRNG